MNSLPRPEDFSKALYTLDIGQNDLQAGFKSMTEKQVLESIPSIIDQFALAVEVTRTCLCIILLNNYCVEGSET